MIGEDYLGHDHIVMPNDSHSEVLFEIQNLSYVGEKSTYFSGISMSFTAPGVYTLVTPAILGRTILLMTLAGRFQPTFGSITIFGVGHGLNLYKHVNIAGFAHIDGLDPHATVVDVITEQISWSLPWFSRVKKITTDNMGKILEPIFGNFTIPSSKTLIGDLNEKDRYLLKLALVEINPKAIIILGGLDQIHDEQYRYGVIERLCELSHKRIIITASTYSTGFSAREYHEYVIALTQEYDATDRNIPGKHALGRYDHNVVPNIGSYSHSDSDNSQL